MVVGIGKSATVVSNLAATIDSKRGSRIQADIGEQTSTSSHGDGGESQIEGAMNLVAGYLDARN